MTGLRTRVEEDADFRVKHLADSIEQPPMGIDLFLVLSFDNEHDLHWDKIICVIAMRDDQLQRAIDRELSGVLK